MGREFCDWTCDSEQFTASNTLFFAMVHRISHFSSVRRPIFTKRVADAKKAVASCPHLIDYWNHGL